MIAGIVPAPKSSASGRRRDKSTNSPIFRFTLRRSPPPAPLLLTRSRHLHLLLDVIGDLHVLHLLFFQISVVDELNLIATRRHIEHHPPGGTLRNRNHPDQSEPVTHTIPRLFFQVR